MPRRILPGFCDHDRLRFFSLKRGSQDGVVCETCRAFWHRERQPFGGTALVRRHISVLRKGLRHDSKILERAALRGESKE